jgi:hypothetical protein
MRYCLPHLRVCLAPKMHLISAISWCSMKLNLLWYSCFLFGLLSFVLNDFNLDTWNLRCVTKVVGNKNIYTLGWGLCVILSGPTYLEMKWAAKVSGILKSQMFNITKSPTSNWISFLDLLAYFQYLAWASSKSFLAQTFNSLHSSTMISAFFPPSLGYTHNLFILVLFFSS